MALSIMSISLNEIAALAGQKGLIAEIHRTNQLAISGRGDDGTPSGNSFWFSVFNDELYLGLWSGYSYRIGTDQYSALISDVYHSSERIIAEVKSDLCEKYSLVQLSDSAQEAFENNIGD